MSEQMWTYVEEIQWLHVAYVINGTPTLHKTNYLKRYSNPNTYNIYLSPIHSETFPNQTLKLFNSTNHELTCTTQLEISPYQFIRQKGFFDERVKSPFKANFECFSLKRFNSLKTFTAVFFAHPYYAGVA